MKKLIVLILALSATGCAHGKRADYCVGNFDKYDSYEACQAEQNAKREKKRNILRALGAAAGAGLSGMGQGLINQSQRRPVTCTTSSYGGVITTNCQ